MSKYHLNCKKPLSPEDTKHKSPKSAQPEIKSKPFCDCNYCMCNDCPDILKMFSVTITENSCDFGPKVNKDCKICKSEPGHSEETVNEINSLLENMNPQGCACEVVARAVVSDVHTNMGLPLARHATEPEESTHTNSENTTQE